LYPHLSDSTLWFNELIHELITKPTVIE